MKKIIIALVVLAVVGAGTYYIVFRNSSGGNSAKDSLNNPQPPQVPSPVPQAKNKSVTVENFSFNPATLIVNKGDTVVWTNLDSVPHKISGPGFESGNLSGDLIKGQSFSFTFDAVGTYDYHCAIHPYMKGTIIVKEILDKG